MTKNDVDDDDDDVDSFSNHLVLSENRRNIEDVI